ncbi:MULTISPECIES: hypothetical protein [Kaistia]|uniref:Uncharacterized protein n=1 Tax=Kaistia nematophila TaxID=2994654 RepID=A0A9X3IMN1_9HYPH|nr:hypothetical protein [Kaistia nematophila]MCX5570095.1 hypothetical protein [Kaistia nematophila]
MVISDGWRAGGFRRARVRDWNMGVRPDPFQGAAEEIVGEGRGGGDGRKSAHKKAPVGEEVDGRSS